MVARLPQPGDKVLPDHEREAEEEDVLPLVLFEKRLQPLRVQLHVLVQREHLVAREHAEAQDARAPRREHGAVLDDGAGVQDNHGQALLAQKLAHDAA